MRTSLQSLGTGRQRIGNSELVSGLEKVLQNRYGRILSAAAAKWEKRFAAGDPSDACVSLRISGWNRTLAGASTDGAR